MRTPDCNDACETCHFGAREICDGFDNDCDGEVDEGGACLDDNAFKYRRLVDVCNQASNAVTTQVLVQINTKELIDSEKMKPDCSDIRFEDSSFQIPHWVENCYSENTNIWVSVSDIPGSGCKTIHMYYGNENYTFMHPQAVFYAMSPEFEGHVYCQSSTASYTCPVTIDAPSGMLFAPYQELNLEMGGYLGYGGPIEKLGDCVVEQNVEAITVTVNGQCIGTFSTGEDECALSLVGPVSYVVEPTQTLTLNFDATDAVDSDPLNCGFFFRVVAQAIYLVNADYSSVNVSISLWI